MYRIAHISDLHLVADGIKVDHTNLQKVAAALGDRAGVKVEANPYSRQQLESLAISMRELQPSAIFITGDVTNYGDPESLQFAADVIEKLRQEAGPDPVTFVVPGNHDTLTERMAALSEDSSLKARLIRSFRRINPELDITYKLAAELEKGEVDGAPVFLKSFWTYIPAKYRPVDPAQPQFIDMRWGQAAVFLFNSNVDDTLMANKGSIGMAAYGRLHGALKAKEHQNALSQAIKIALLHHHPISAPQSIDPDVERFFNWMDDGPRFLHYLNDQRFTLVLHGHQHAPFICTINYRKEDDRPLHVVAAGSATQAGGPASFNLIDFLSPLEVRVQRFDYRDPDFVPDIPSHCRLPVRSPGSIRLTRDSEPEIAEDGAIRNLLRPSDDAYDTDIEYTLLDYRVTITKNQRYVADYRRVGTVRGKAGQNGTVFVITGSPAMKITDMNVQVADSVNKEILVDQEVRKIFRLSPKGQQLRVGDSFDVTLHFEWQADETEPHDFDAFNLMNIRHPVGRFHYEVTYPWIAAKIAVYEFVLERRPADCRPADDVKTVPGSTILTVDLDKPRPVAYLICFSKELKSYL